MKIEKIEVDLKIEDVRSTIYVVRALWIALTAIICLAFFLEITRGLAITAGIVINDLLVASTDWIFNLIGM